MADQIGGVAAMAASPRGEVRLEECRGGRGVNTAFVSFVVGDLTPPMRAALRERQSDLFGRDLLASGHPATIKALQRRGIVEGSRCTVTEFGEMVIGAAGLDGEGADGAQ